ncbi:MAG: hypothetical protein IT305_13295 [Chloroflexi bacterium]|nr:hypothetical protein [Chloroflexota bacterium]
MRRASENAGRGVGFGTWPYTPLLRMSLVLGAVIGFAYGLTVLLLLAFRVGVGGNWLALAQAHGQAQVSGFVALLVMAVAVILFPRFLSSPLDAPRLCLIGGAVVAASVVLRAVGQPLPDSLGRSVVLLASGILAPIGFVCYVVPQARGVRRSVQPWALWRSFAVAGVSSFGASLLLGLWACLRLASGLPIVPLALDEAIVHLQLWGFAATFVMTIGLKIFPQFLILRPPHARAFPPVLALYIGGVWLTTIGWLLLEVDPARFGLASTLRAVGAVAEAVALIGYCSAIRLYEPAARPSGTPHITNPTRTWFRLAFGFILVAAIGAAFYAMRDALGGAGATFNEASAIRHALAMGFLLPIIFGMAGRILPIFSADVLRHRWLLPTIVWLAFVGALARVVGEWVGGYAPSVAPLVAAGGILGTLAFLIFAGALWLATDRMPAS